MQEQNRNGAGPGPVRRFLVNAAAPIFVVCAGFTLVALAVHTDTGSARAPAQDAQPTPYSADHARVQAMPGEPEEQPPTF
jgi:hypothetical protein